MLTCAGSLELHPKCGNQLNVETPKHIFIIYATIFILYVRFWRYIFHLIKIYCCRINMCGGLWNLIPMCGSIKINAESAKHIFVMLATFFHHSLYVLAIYISSCKIIFCNIIVCSLGPGPLLHNLKQSDDRLRMPPGNIILAIYSTFSRELFHPKKSMT